MKVTMMMAMTADGKIAKNDHHLPTDWTSKEDKKQFAEISKKAGAVMMGEKTFRTFPAPLPGRLNVVFTLEKDPTAIPGVKWVTGDPEPILAELERMGYTEVLLGGGAFLNGLFLEKKLINEIIITIEPLIFGDGMSLFNRAADTGLELMETKKLNDNTLMLRYKVIY